jgi:hypothetical protein
MEYESIKAFQYDQLIRNLPNIVRAFAVSTKISRPSRAWHRINLRKYIINANIPEEIEDYVINKLYNLEKIEILNINFAVLLDVFWRVSHKSFESALANIMNRMVSYINKKYSKNIFIVVENVKRNNIRAFNPLYFQDMSWALCVYFSKLIINSNVISISHKYYKRLYPRKPDKYLFSKENKFPIEYDYEKIAEGEDINTIIKENNNEMLILYICKSIGNNVIYYNRFDRFISECSKSNKKLVLVWELRPCKRIVNSLENIKLFQGFTENNFIEIENYLKKYAQNKM